MFIQVAIPMKVATISRKRNLMKFTKYSYTFKTAKIANKNYKYITNIIANKLNCRKNIHILLFYFVIPRFSTTGTSAITSTKKKNYTIHLTRLVDSKLYFDHNYSSNPVVLKDIIFICISFAAAPAEGL